MTRWAKITFTFERTHNYPNAPDEVSFLRNPHRHVFHATVWIQQFHNERDIEYILAKNHLRGFAQSRYWDMSTSCETFAEEIGLAARRKYGENRLTLVEVTEDGENGAVIALETDATNAKQEA